MCTKHFAECFNYLYIIFVKQLIQDSPHHYLRFGTHRPSVSLIRMTVDQRFWSFTAVITEY